MALIHQPPPAKSPDEEVSSEDNHWRPLILASIGAALPLTVVTFMLLVHFGGTLTTDHVRDLGQAVAALAAAVGLAFAASGAPARTRRAWMLLSASGASAFIGQVIEVIGQEVAFPTPAEVGLLFAVLFAVAGLLSFPSEQNIYASRLHTVLDFLMVAFSLAFIAIGFGLLQDYTKASAEARWLGPLFPAADVLLLTVIFVMLRRNRPTRRGRMALLMAGFTIIVLSDSVNTILTAEDLAPSIRILFGAGAMYGFTLVALAPLWPRGIERQQKEDQAIWQVLLPYAGVVAVLATAIGSELIAHKTLPVSVDLPAAGLVVVLIVNQVVSFLEGRALLRQSRQAEAKVRERETMLNNVIDYAPQGVARITPDRRIANGNPRLASMLYAPKRLVEGHSLDMFLPHEDVERAFGTFAAEVDGSQETVEVESRARRADGSEFWMHWSLTPIRHQSDGRIDYYMAMFEDITAKREADETASANLQQMEKLNRLKSEFVSMVSHEFRSALVGIQGFSELIRDNDLDVSPTSRTWPATSTKTRSASTG